MALPCSVREDAVRAELKDGVLSIVLPKSDEAKRRKVDVVVQHGTLTVEWMPDGHVTMTGGVSLAYRGEL